MLPLAMDLGIRITIENHGGVSGTVVGILAVIRGTDPKWVGSNLDFGNAPVNQNPDVFARLVPYAYHTHAKLDDFKENGEATNSDYAKLLGMLKSAKYAGAVSIEWEGNGEAVQGVKKTRDLILKHWPELPN
jgi:sugar phosphate isomerase/epimerase